jgi:cytoplasmic tRNA 2-thiolation protein 1
MFRRGDKVAVAVSGGKDSTVLAHLMCTLNARHGYGLDLFLLSIDEGIAGYRDDSLDTVKRNEQEYGIPLRVVSFQQLYGWTMDEIVRAVGTTGNCTYCGVFRRQALDRGAMLCGADKIVTGHNADDNAETVIMNLLRSDHQRLGRCVDPVTGEFRNKKSNKNKKKHEVADGKSSGAGEGNEVDVEEEEEEEDEHDNDEEEEESASEARDTVVLDANGVPVDDRALLPPARAKPLRLCFEKDIVLYAHHKKLDYFSTECVYAPFSYRGFARDLIKKLERERPRAILDILRSAEQFLVRRSETVKQVLRQCAQCSYLSSQPLCTACTNLEHLRKLRPRVKVALELGADSDAAPSATAAASSSSTTPPTITSATTPAPAPAPAPRAFEASLLRDIKPHPARIDW